MEGASLFKKVYLRKMGYGIAFAALFILHACINTAPNLPTLIPTEQWPTVIHLTSSAAQTLSPSPRPLTLSPTSTESPTLMPLASSPSAKVSTPTPEPESISLPQPYTGPCSPDMLSEGASSPQPGNWASYVGYRFSGDLLSDNYGWVGGFMLPDSIAKGFAMEVYNQAEPEQVLFALLRLVCYLGDHPYFEVTDIVLVPSPGPYQAIIFGEGIYSYPTIIWDAANGAPPAGLLGFTMGLTCSPQAPGILALAQLDSIPTSVGPESLVPAYLLKAWRLDLTRQRFVPLDSNSLTCKAGYMTGPP